MIVALTVSSDRMVLPCLDHSSMKALQISGVSLGSYGWMSYHLLPRSNRLAIFSLLRWPNFSFMLRRFSCGTHSPSLSFSKASGVNTKRGPF